MPDDLSLTRKIENAVVTLLTAVSALTGVAKRPGIDEAALGTPYLVVNANRQGEVIHGSGVHEILVTVGLKTTCGNGPKATDDSTFLEYDSALEALLIGGSMSALAAAIAAATDYFGIYAAKNPSSTPAAFDDTRREITYAFTLHAFSTDS